jgi:F1F0 ATPase subunit 2
MDTHVADHWALRGLRKCLALGGSGEQSDRKTGRRTSMNDALILAGDLLAGVLLGAFFFGGLWWTIRKGSPSEWSGLLFSASLLLRMAVAVTGFYLVSHGEWRKLVACLAGFLLARIAVTRLIRLPSAKSTRILQEGGQ